MGTTIHYSYRYGGDETLVRTALETVRSEISRLPVKRVGEITPISHVRFSGGATELEDLEFVLGLALRYHFNVFDLPDDERCLIDRRILEGGHGLGFCVDVDEGCDGFRVILGHVGDSPLWSGHDCTKTAWAEDFDRAHGLVIDMLEVCHIAGILETVSDEAGIWQELLA